MSMLDAIRDFHTQFLFKPEIVNGDKWLTKEKFVVAGMGGSGHSADLLKCREPRIDVHVHRNYGIPVLPGEKYEEHSFIASSYSGNTEEPVDFMNRVFEVGQSLGVIGTGGNVISFAKDNLVPHILIPDTGIQPRSASGYSIIAMAKMMGLNNLLGELRVLGEALKPESFEQKGVNLSGKIADHVPVIYTSDRNRAIANNWKIKFNETGKIPAYYDVFPELNHNEMNGFDHVEKNEGLSKHFHFIFITDSEDHERVQKRMHITKEMYENRGLGVEMLSLEGGTRFERIFNSLLIADWTAFYTAKYYGAESEEVPMVEEFKKLL